MLKQQMITRLVAWIRARDTVRVTKEAGRPKPWTTDPILRAWRFCNVRREDDAVTRWISQHWRTPYAEDPMLWFAMCIARLVNNPSTLNLMGYPEERWKPRHFERGMSVATARYGKPWGPAYIVSTNGHAMPKPQYVAQRVLAPLWNARKDLTKQYLEVETLAAFHAQLMKFDGLGSFMAAQVVADLKYAHFMNDCEDWATWAASGPGSRRGMNRIMERDVNVSMAEKVWLERLQELRTEVNKRLSWSDPLHAQDLQNCLCEFDKYERERLGQGHPKRKYAGEK
jgi:hypothetical protein